MGTIIVTPDNMRMLNELRGPAANFSELSHIGSAGRPSMSKAQHWTQTRYKALDRQIKQMKTDEPVTLLNMNPFPLKINGGVYFPEEIPACPVGKPYTVHVIRDVRWGHKDNGCDMQNMFQMEPVPAIPMVLASEYIREYVQRDGGFGGVLCYAGDKDPASIRKGETVRVPTVNFDERGELYLVPEEQDFYHILAMVKQRRNTTIMSRLQQANSWYENDSQRNYVNDTHRDMARLALREHLIPDLPRWVMIENTLMEKQPDPCPSCMVVPLSGAILCANCGHIFDVIKAFLNARVAYGSVEMERLTAEEWGVVNKIQAERQKNKGLKSKEEAQ